MRFGLCGATEALVLGSGGPDGFLMEYWRTVHKPMLICWHLDGLANRMELEMCKCFVSHLCCCYWSPAELVLAGEVGFQPRLSISDACQY